MTRRLRDERTVQLLRWFDHSHLPAGLPRHVSALCAELAREMVRHLRDGPELTTGLRKLLEAKDALVRQAITDGEDADRSRGARE